jgi:hypothetical protein
MMAVSNDTIKELGGNDATKTGEEFIELQKTHLKKTCSAENTPIIQRGSLSYCEQAYWIRNMSIRDNILFGKPMDETRYVQTVIACCLERDFEILNAGDLTEIGEKGINPPGG